MNSMSVTLGLELLSLARELGTDYLEARLKSQNKDVITEDDLHDIAKEDLNPGDVFDHD